MKSPATWLLGAFLLPAVAGAGAAAPVSTAALETELKEHMSAERIGSYIETVTAHPTFPGSPFSANVARQTLAWFREWGWQAEIETYSVLFPRPLERLVELETTPAFVARLREPVVAGDPYSEQQAEHLESYFIYSPDGDVTAPAVYVNYGLRDDYDELERLGQSARGRIVIVRSGVMWRGGKVELAAEHGAVGVLVYSDPKEDGYYRGPTYPAGAWRSRDGVQRGSVLYGRYAGDPLTPMTAAVPRAPRMPRDSPATSLARIPAMPLSYADAQPILASMTGPTAPEGWRGALPITYRAGPTAAAVHLKVRFDWKSIDIHDVVATLPGSVYADETIIRGNHHDGWVYGAQDPHSGHSAMLEEARVLGELYRKGWRPKRTIIYTSWDAEEQGVIGSTEYVERHLAELTRNAVVYLNTDVTGPGTLGVSGSPSWSGFVTDLAAAIRDPASGVSLLARMEVKREADVYGPQGAGGTAWKAPDGDPDAVNHRIPMGAPGYGSDHHSFVSYAGVSTLSLAFTDNLNLGSYHSIYDDFHWYREFGDPGFAYGRATAQLNGVAVFRLANAELLPLDFTSVATATAAEVARLKAIYERERARAAAERRARELGAYAILRDPADPRTAPAAREVPVIDFAPLDAETAAIRRASAHFSAALGKAGERGLPQPLTRRINAALLRVERAYLRSGGLPDRAFYRNELYSPGRLWDTVPLPAIGDAFLDRDWDRARTQVAPAAGTLGHIAAAIEAAAGELDAALR
jgi:N-acetylated-alpha-linked acidic dipeptidase